MPDKVKLNGCVNCCACVMACSMHHTGAFGYQNASIAIIQEDDGFSVSFVSPNTCDTCEGEGNGNYRCVKYCYRAQDALRQFSLTQGKGGECV